MFWKILWFAWFLGAFSWVVGQVIDGKNLTRLQQAQHKSKTLPILSGLVVCLMGCVWPVFTVLDALHWHKNKDKKPVATDKTPPVAQSLEVEINGQMIDLSTPLKPGNDKEKS